MEDVIANVYFSCEYRPTRPRRWPVFACVAVLFIICLASGAQSATLESEVLGTYESGPLGDNRHAVLQLEQVGDAIIGQMTDENGVKYALKGKAGDRFVQGKFFHLNRSSAFVAERVGRSLFLTYTPIENRSSRTPRSLLLKRKAPSQSKGTFAAGSNQEFANFLVSYQKWGDHKVANSFAKLTSGHRSLVQMFGHLHADLFIRVCRGGNSPAVKAARSELGWSQSLNCRSTVKRARYARQRKSLQEMSARALEQARTLAGVVSCAGRVGETIPSPKCGRLGVSFSPVASAWRDVATMLPLTPPPAELVIASADAGSGGKKLPENQTVLTALNTTPASDFPKMKPLAVAAKAVDKRQATLLFRPLDVGWKLEAKAQLHEWSLLNSAFADVAMGEELDDMVTSAGAPR